MKLLYALRTLVQRTVDGGGDSEGTTDNGTDADEEAGERFAARFAVDDLHWRNILHQSQQKHVTWCRDGANCCGWKLGVLLREEEERGLALAWKNLRMRKTRRECLP
jgi:hypothetical protein